MGDVKNAITLIKTFAVLDIETTGLPAYNFGKTSITEISILSCSKENIINANEKCEIPRVIHKLTLCFNPFLTIQAFSANITGLNNYILEEENKFDENAANGIITFLKHLPGPVCLVSHNGKRFDFPILKKHFDKVNVKIPDDILIIDSLEAFKEIDKTGQINFPTPVIDSANSENVVQYTDGETKVDDACVNRQTLNETTPHRPTDKTNMRRRFRVADGGYKAQFKSRRELFPDGAASASPEKKITSNNSPKNVQSYKLCKVYERVFGSEPKLAHYAEADVKALLKIMLFYRDLFVRYAEYNAIPFAAIN